jgi:hypothetical protein
MNYRGNPINPQRVCLERDLSDPILLAREDDHLGRWAHLEFKALAFLLVEALAVEAAPDNLVSNQISVQEVSGFS